MSASQSRLFPEWEESYLFDVRVGGGVFIECVEVLILCVGCLTYEDGVFQFLKFGLDLLI